MDDYNMELGRIVKKKFGVFEYVKKEEFEGIYFDQLKPIFEETTGLYLSL
jgi:hypothetical protein